MGQTKEEKKAVAAGGAPVSNFYLRPPRAKPPASGPKDNPLARKRKEIVERWAYHALGDHEWATYGGDIRDLTRYCGECREFVAEIHKSEEWRN